LSGNCIAALHHGRISNSAVLDGGITNTAEQRLCHPAHLKCGSGEYKHLECKKTLFSDNLLVSQTFFQPKFFPVFGICRNIS